MLDFIVMEMTRGNREKGSDYMVISLLVSRCPSSFKTDFNHFFKDYFHKHERLHEVRKAIYCRAGILGERGPKSGVV